VLQRAFIFEAPSLRVQFFCRKGHLSQAESLAAMADSLKAYRAEQNARKSESND
jgi:hypothetical protein